MPDHFTGQRCVHHFTGEGSHDSAVDGDEPYCGEFSRDRWPPEVLQCLRVTALARDERWVALHHRIACDAPHPSSWWIRAAEIGPETECPAGGPESLEHHLVSESLDWSVVIDEYNVLRVHGDEAFVAAFRADFERRLARADD